MTTIETTTKRAMIETILSALEHKAEMTNRAFNKAECHITLLFRSDEQLSIKLADAHRYNNHFAIA